MQISVLGLGYVGCVTAACMARDGHEIIGVDINPQKVELLNAGYSPIVEPGLDDLIEAAARSDRLQATTDTLFAVSNSEVVLICVGTPSNRNGSIKLDHIEYVCREVGAALASSPGHRTIVVRSTVMPGTLEEVVLPLLEHHSGMRAGVDFSLCMNPEFLREGSAIQDYYHPSYIVIGELDAASGSRLEPAYAAVGAPIIRTTLRVAEMLKYTCNAFHAVKVVFANEIGNLCKAHGIDGHDVMDIFCQDRQLNISPAYLRPGYSFGGSCLPKDLRALLYRARERDTDAPLLHAAVVSNEQQIRRAIELVERTGKRRVGVLGLSFKPGTDDIRESPVVPVIETLLGRGYRVSVFDEQVQLSKLIGRNKSYIEQQVPHIASLMRPSVDSLLADADVVVLAHGSERFHGVAGQIRPEQILIDLVGLARRRTDIRGSYEGICW